MKFAKPNLQSFITPRNGQLVLVAAYLTVMNTPAFAQLEKGTNMLNSVSAWLTAIAVTLVTLATMFVGIRMMFQAAQWKDVAPVFWGGVLIGGASGIGALLTA